MEVLVSGWKKAGSYPECSIRNGGRVSGRVKQDTAWFENSSGRGRPYGKWEWKRPLKLMARSSSLLVPMMSFSTNRRDQGDWLGRLGMRRCVLDVFVNVWWELGCEKLKRVGDARGSYAWQARLGLAAPRYGCSRACACASFQLRSRLLDDATLVPGSMRKEFRNLYLAGHNGA